MKFEARHIGTNANDQALMLDKIGVKTLDELINLTIPAKIQLDKKLDFCSPLSENSYLKWVNQLAQENQLFQSFIGQGYYGTLTPSVILRNIFENPAWYTAYTPYQAEISQGRMEALLNYQTLVCELTGMEIANASLLDEATAAAEAMIMLWGSRDRKAVAEGKNVFLVDHHVFKQTKLVIQTRAKYLGIKLIEGDLQNIEVNTNVFGALVQYPNAQGALLDYAKLNTQLSSQSAHLVCASDLMALCSIQSPDSFGASVVVGSAQRFGVPMSYGGPHAAFFASKAIFKRNLPGRIIGVSKDTKDRYALRMALQTREQHIKREKATSNICTAQALLAIMASMYAVYHGPKGLKSISAQIHQNTLELYTQLKEFGYQLSSEHFFDTFTVFDLNTKAIQQLAEVQHINLNYINDTHISISIDELTSAHHIDQLSTIFKNLNQQSQKVYSVAGIQSFIRKEDYLTQEVFNTHHSETQMMRYIKKLEQKDISLMNGMISLGSCTMKLNAASQMMPLSNPLWNNIHPFAPKNQCKGYQKVLSELGDYLKEITGFKGISFQPNSGAQGELAGLLTIKKYFECKGESHRNLVLIPQSAHGTNPASAKMAGMDVLVTLCDEEGNIDLVDLKNKIDENKSVLAAIMVTYPSTHGVFESSILAITQMVHEAGGQVYMDGANMNAQVGLTSPAKIGADVCHLNLHKTFAIPHGGGGPGMGPIGVAAHLIPHLPADNFEEISDESLGIIAASAYSSALILLISLAYIKLLGAEGITNATKAAILHANYLKAKLNQHYPILYVGENGTVAHEMILDCRAFKNSGIDVMDIAKRLIDYGFHSPTVSFPVAGTLMIEPTESEDLAELDKFAAAMIAIAEEIKEIAQGIYPKDNNVLINAPHTAEDLLTDEWLHSYSRTKAAYPLEYLKTNKYWSPISRVDNAYGDRNLICTCPSTNTYLIETE